MIYVAVYFSTSIVGFIEYWFFSLSYKKKKYIYIHIYIHTYIYISQGFPGGSDGKESACNLGDPASIPGLERSPGEGNGYPL